MNIRNYGLSMALIATVVVPWMISGCDQVVTQCQVGKATAFGYAAVYKMVSTTGDCSASPLPTGETIGLDDYHPVSGMTRDFTKADVYFQVGSLYDTQQFADACYAPGDPSTGYKGGAFDDTNKTDTVWAVGKFKDFLPDANDFCYVDDLTVAQQHIPAIPATKAGTNPPGACFSPAEPGGQPGQVPAAGAVPCDNGDGTFTSACVCAKPGQDNCCDKFYAYCTGSFDPCTVDSDCCDPTDMNCIKHDKGLCSQTPVKVCDAPDPNTGFAVGCTTDADCAPIMAKCSTTPTAASSFCTNAPAIIGCLSDDDCCDPMDTKCLNKPHSCLPGGVDLTSCHTAEIPAQDISFTWSNVKIYNTAAAPGTQFTATVDKKTGTCEQKYNVVALWPSVSCDGGNYTGTPGKPFPAACCPGSDAKDGIPLGSGINPDFAVVCDPTLLICVLDVNKSIPQLDTKGYPDICPKPESIPDGQ